MRNPPAHRIGELINYSYHKKRIEELFALKMSLPDGPVQHVKAWAIEHGATQRDILSWDREDFNTIMKRLVAHGFSTTRRYRWMLQWCALKHELLGRLGAPFLTLEQSFFERMYLSVEVVQANWARVVPLSHQYFLRLPWLLSHLVRVIDTHYAVNEWWYKMHWGSDMQLVKSTATRYALIWDDLLRILYSRSIVTRDVYEANKL